MELKGEPLPGFWRQIHEDWLANGKDWTAAGFRALAVYRLARRLPGIHSRLLRAPLSRTYLLLYRYVRNVYGIELPQNTKVGRRFTIAHQGGIVIHPNSEIGDDCLIRQNVTIGAGTEGGVVHGPKLGNDVQVGAGAVIIGRVTLGDGVRVAPNTVVTTDVPPKSSVFGNPSRIIQLPGAARPKQKRGANDNPQSTEEKHA